MYNEYDEGRSEVVSVRVNQKFWTQLAGWIKRSGLSRSEFLRIALVRGATQLAITNKLLSPNQAKEITEDMDFKVGP